MKFLYLILLAINFISCGYHSKKADLIIHNAVIYSSDEKFSIHHAMAIKDGEIIEIGPERQITNKYYASKNIDNMGRPIYPNFIGIQEPIKHFKSTLKNFQATEPEKRQDALWSLTRFKAHQEMIETSGFLSKNMEADFFITNADLMTTPYENIHKIKVIDVFENGKSLK